MATPNPRYDGKPLLRLLELYVLHEIGSLTPADERMLKDLTPKLRSTYRKKGEWHEIIAGIMGFPPGVAAGIRETWTRNKKMADYQGVPLSPQQFAEAFIDANVKHDPP